MPKFAVMMSPRQIVIEERNRRKLRSGEIRARILCAGICKTDSAIFSGDYVVPLPLVLGHEWVGEVLETGSPEHKDLMGKRITAEINNTCLSYGLKKPCAACLKGIPNHCLTRDVTGIVKHDGAFAEEIIIPYKTVYKIPKEITNERAVFIEPLAAAIRTFELSPIKKGDVVVIIGAGKLGMLIAIVAKYMQAEVMLFSKSSKRAKLAKKFSLILNALPASDEEFKKIVQKKTNGLGADMAVDATGNPETIAISMNIVRPRGIVSLKSTPGIPFNNFNITKFVVDEITLQGTRCGHFEKAIAFLKKHKPPLEEMIVDSYPLEKTKNALDLSETAPGKIIIKP